MNTVKASWVGTIPLFVIFILIILGSFICCLYLGWISLFFIPQIWIKTTGSLIIGLIYFILLLNIRIPRKFKAPSSDLVHMPLIANGAWTEVYKMTESNKVIKQLYFCGWGHNDYKDHLAPVIGPKKCGKRNPFVLWFIHYYMILYQIIGLKRRLKY